MPIATQVPDRSAGEGILAPAKERFNSASDLAWLSHPLFGPLSCCWPNSMVVATIVATVNVETASRATTTIVTWRVTAMTRVGFDRDSAHILRRSLRRRRHV